MVLNQATGGRLRWSSGDPAVDCTKNGEGGGLFVGAGRIEGDDARQDNEAPAFCGFHGDDDVAAAEEVGEGNALEAKGDVIDNLSRGREGASGCGAESPDG